MALKIAAQKKKLRNVRSSALSSSLATLETRMIDGGIIKIYCFWALQRLQELVERELNLIPNVNLFTQGLRATLRVAETPETNLTWTRGRGCVVVFFSCSLSLFLFLVGSLVVIVVVSFRFLSYVTESFRAANWRRIELPSRAHKSNLWGRSIKARSERQLNA